MSEHFAWKALRRIMDMSKEGKDDTMKEINQIARQTFLTFDTKDLDRSDQFDALRRANIARDSQWDPEGKLSKLFRSNEFAEEALEAVEVVLQLIAATEIGSKVGNVLGVVKKLEREELGLKGSRKTISDLEHEVGDTLITLDLLCMVYGIDLWQATKGSFNKKSEEHGFEVKL